MSCPIRPKNLDSYGPSPIPEEGGWVQSKEIKDVSGFFFFFFKCAPEQGTC